jgi:hypothetical protein
MPWIFRKCESTVPPVPHLDSADPGYFCRRVQAYWKCMVVASLRAPGNPCRFLRSAMDIHGRKARKVLFVLFCDVKDSCCTGYILSLSAVPGHSSGMSVYLETGNSPISLSPEICFFNTRLFNNWSRDKFRLWSSQVCRRRKTEGAQTYFGISSS